MRILLCIDAPADPNGGASGTVVQTAAALRRRGHEVDCVWSDDLPHRVKHWNLHYLLELPWALRREVARRCQGKRYDVIQVNQPFSWAAAVEHRRQRRAGVFITQTQGWEPRLTTALQPWRRRYGVPEWGFPRGLLGRPLRFALERRYARWAAVQSHGVLTSCSEDTEYIEREYSLGSGRVGTIPMGVPDPFLSSAPPPMRPERAARVLYVGQFAFFKGVHVLAEIYDRLVGAHPGISLGWCCPPEQQDEARRLLSPEARRGVTFYPPVPQVDLVTRYDQSGVFVFPTLAEGFGKVFLEAMARGMLVVGSHAAGMRDVIVSGENGWTVPVGDAPAFAARITAVLADPVLAERVSRGAAAAARSYTWDRTAAESERFYLDLLARESPT